MSRTQFAITSLSSRLPRLRISSACSALQCSSRNVSPPFRSLRAHSRANSTTSDCEYEDFYRYTSGRWIWDEEARLRERYRRFNVHELKKLAARSSGAAACVSISKLAEGGFNKVFRLVMDDGTIVIARIPNPNAGPPFLTTASEVATMDFVRTVLDIPVPKVLAWSGEAGNPVESEYILMEEAAGTQLATVWHAMELSDKLEVVKDIVAIETKLLSLSFTRYGCLYFADDAFPGCQKAEVIGKVLPSLKKVAENRFVLGPVVDRDFWHQERASMNVDRGPWESPYDYLRAIAQREINWINCYAAQKVRPMGGLVAASKAQRSPDAHIALYKRFLEVAKYIFPKGDQAKPAIWHCDIHSANIFADAGRVTSLIDWQAIWAGPLFLQARHPRLVRHNGESVLQLPENYETIEDDDEKMRLRTQVEKSMVSWTYETETKNTNPLLHDTMHIAQERNRTHTIAFSSNTWDGDIMPFRQCLIRIVRHWDEINPEIPCPIGFTDEEIKAHLSDGEGWNEIADLWDALQEVVCRDDGWTTNEDYDGLIELFANLRKTVLQDTSISTEDLSAFEETTRWLLESKPT